MKRRSERLDICAEINSGGMIFATSAECLDVALTLAGLCDPPLIECVRVSSAMSQPPRCQMQIDAVLFRDYHQHSIT